MPTSRCSTKQYQQFVRTRQAAVHSYMGYDDTISRLRTRAAEALQTVNQLMAKQGHLIETVAIDELKTRRARLEVYQTQARYAVADSYDRAAKAQGHSAGITQAALRQAGRRTMMRSRRALFARRRGVARCVLQRAAEGHAGDAAQGSRRICRT